MKSLFPIIVILFTLPTFPLFGETIRDEKMPKFFSTCSITAEKVILKTVDDRKIRNFGMTPSEETVIGVNDEEKVFRDFHWAFSITPVKKETFTVWIFEETKGLSSFGGANGVSSWGYQAWINGKVEPLTTEGVKEFAKERISSLMEPVDEKIFETLLDDSKAGVVTVVTRFKESVIKKRKAEIALEIANSGVELEESPPSPLPPSPVSQSALPSLEPENAKHNFLPYLLFLFFSLLVACCILKKRKFNR
jgi:hypothetical protein